MSLVRYCCERCAVCGRGLTWMEIAFGRVFDPICGRCLAERERRERPTTEDRVDLSQPLAPLTWDEVG